MCLEDIQPHGFLNQIKGLLSFDPRNLRLPSGSLPQEKPAFHRIPFLHRNSGKCHQRASHPLFFSEWPFCPIERRILAKVQNMPININKAEAKISIQKRKSIWGLRQGYDFIPTLARFFLLYLSDSFPKQKECFPCSIKLCLNSL